MNTETAAQTCIDAIRDRHKIFICGNGGSAGQAQHFAAELVGKFKHDRRALPCISLTTDTSILTSVSNDFGYKYVFTRQLEALAEPGDVLITLSTSGRSQNVRHAIRHAKENDMKLIDLQRIGKTAECQEHHLCMLHEMAEKIEEAFI